MLSLSKTTIAADLIDNEVDRLKTNIRIDWRGVVAPINRFLLIRKDAEVCAVRFTEFHRGHDAKPATLFNSGEETFYAEYDWYCQADGSQDLTKSNIQSGHKKLVRKPLRGIGRLAFQTGEINVRCGSFSLYWSYPTAVAFYGVPKQADYGIELSPTKWKEIKEVKALDPNIKWYRLDEKRQLFYISINDL